MSKGNTNKKPYEKVQGFLVPLKIDTYMAVVCTQYLGRPCMPMGQGSHTNGSYT